MEWKKRVFNIASEDVSQIAEHFSMNLPEALYSPTIRQFIAKVRWLRSGKPVEVFEQFDENAVGGVVTHNRRQIDDTSFASAHRTIRLLHPLSGLSPVYEKAAKLKVLSIGPRTEMELLHLVALGFTSDNIFAVDLISTSPFIDLGDAHDLPYQTDFFDVVIAGWVINYTRSPETILKEMVRVTKKDGLVAIGATHAFDTDETYFSEANSKTLVNGCSFGNSRDLLDKMPAGTEFEIHFLQEPRHSDAKRLLFIARLIDKIPSQ